MNPVQHAPEELNQHHIINKKLNTTMKEEKKSDLSDQKPLRLEDAQKLLEEFRKMPYSYDKAGQVSVQQYKGGIKATKPDTEKSEEE